MRKSKGQDLKLMTVDSGERMSQADLQEIAAMIAELFLRQFFQEDEGKVTQANAKLDEHTSKS